VRIGFTGTPRGMTERQRQALSCVLDELQASVFHHGDCIGADAEAHDIAATMGCELVIHPAITETKRAWKQAAQVYEPKLYLVRNKDIVQATDVLVAAPADNVERLRSGTWSTVRFARKAGRPVWIVLPAGSVLQEGRWGSSGCAAAPSRDPI
jgi:hypothetical protein